MIGIAGGAVTSLVAEGLLNTRQLLLISCVLFGGAALAASASPPPRVVESINVYAKPQLLVPVQGDRKIHLYCTGKGSPVVLIFAGAGDWVGGWRNVQGPIAARTRVCAWDRACFGYSDPSGDQQDISHTTGDFEQALKRANIRGPYIVVGHSLGGLEALLFADRHSKEVTGMVLVDPTPLDFSRFLQAAMPKMAAFQKASYEQLTARLRKCADAVRSGALSNTTKDPDKCLEPPEHLPSGVLKAFLAQNANPDRFLTQASFFDQFDRNSQIAVNEKRNYGAMPLRVLTAGVLTVQAPNMPQDLVADLPKLRAEARRSHDVVARLSTDGSNVEVAGAGHLIQREKPEAVIDAIDEVLDKVRAKRAVAARN